MCSTSVRKSEPFILETDRLRIIPLTIAQFKLLLSGMEELERELILTPSNYCMDENTQQAMEFQYHMAVENADNLFWLTNWQIILKPDNRSVASFCFKNIPDDNGEVEIGYGTNPEFTNRGIMTETVKTLTNWALLHPMVKGIIAETLKDNIASHRVLAKNGMIIYKETEETFWWKLEK